MNETFKIAIDGYSGTGKSTLAKQMAKKLNFVYLDTGAMYRGITYYALKNDYIIGNRILKKKLVQQLNQIHFDFNYNGQLQNADIFLNGENIESYIRSIEVSNLVGSIASIKQIREAMVRQQLQIAKGKNIILDGRDIGTAVFPNANLKLFIVASEEIRARRRYKELRQKGENVTYKKVFENLKQRDKLDTTREESPLVKAKDAITIDNSNLTMEAFIDKAIELYNNIK